ncbi:MAG: histidine ammonia-lyase [Silvanigrellales bacterium]|nr:histidine ammonia-lyase [Silvanigrellales bacterium]
MNSHLSGQEAVVLTGEDLSLKDFICIARHGVPVELGNAALVGVRRARECIERRLASGEIFYGINTGFGALADVHIPSDKVTPLQLNLIRSHACGVGEPLPAEVVRGVLALRIQTMLRGNSGVTESTIRLMAEFLNRDILPVVPSKGSVGACGDLAPLAHVALALVGEGDVLHGGERMPAKRALESLGLVPLVPGAKEGLCLINGTQVMTALGLLCLEEARSLLKTADICAAMTVDATRGTATAFRPEIQDVRPHPGQIESARNLMSLLADDAIRLAHSSCGKVQDPYSLRCAPQVHGAARNAWHHVAEVLLREANSSTDNPLVFPETDEILSGGNFHGEPVAMVLDYLAIAMSEIANISERRIEKLVNPHMSGLPPFLTPDSGLNSGFMIPHVVAAALVSENKILSHPASVDSIPTSAEKEDHVSMGMTSALKLRTILSNVAHVLTIEALAAAQGLEFHRPFEGGAGVRAAYAKVREISAPMNVDRSLAGDMALLQADFLTGQFVLAVEGMLPSGELL